MWLPLYLVLPVLILPTGSFGANILFYHGAISSKSHNAALVPIMEKLVNEGHNLTLFSPYSYNGAAKVHHACPEIVKHENDLLCTFFGSFGLEGRLETNEKISVYNFLDTAFEINSRVAHDRETLDWIKGSSFDLVVLDTFYHEFVFAAAHFWKAKVIVYQPCSILFPWDLFNFNVPDEMSWMPQYDTPPSLDYNFFHRLSTQIRTYLTFWKYESVYLPQVEKYSRDLLGLADMPSLQELIRSKTELVFVNFDAWNQFAMPLPPFVISVSGSAFNRSRRIAPLPEEIQTWLEAGESEDFVYVSFGSLINVTSAPASFTNMFFSALEQLPLKVLLKWNGERPKDMPSNVFTSQWYPQLDVLEHQHIRGFVMQGGQNSFQEAILNGVPMIVIPLLGEQDLTARFVHLQGLGHHLEFHTLSVEKLRDAILQIISEPRYAHKVGLMRQQFFNSNRDPAENAFMWIQRVLRGDDLSYLKPPSWNQQWWTYRSLDVLLFAFLSAVCVMALVATMVCWCLVKFVLLIRKGLQGSLKVKNS